MKRRYSIARLLLCLLLATIGILQLQLDQFTLDSDELRIEVADSELEEEDEMEVLWFFAEEYYRFSAEVPMLVFHAVEMEHASTHHAKIRIPPPERSVA